MHTERQSEKEIVRGEKWKKKRKDSRGKRDWGNDENIGHRIN